MQQKPGTTFGMHDAAQEGDADKLQEQFEAAEEKMGDEYDPEADGDDVGIDDRDCWEATVLHTAIMHAQLDALRKALELGAEPSTGCAGSPAIHLALSVGAVRGQSQFAHDALQVLLEAGCSPTQVDDDGQGPAHIAAANGLTKCLETIIATVQSAGGGASGSGAGGDTGSGVDEGILMMLLDEQDERRRSILMEDFGVSQEAFDAAKSKQGGGGDSKKEEKEAASSAAGAPDGAGEQRVEQLLGARDRQGRTPLHCAADFGQSEAAELLLSRGASARAQDALGRTPAHSASGGGHPALADRLVRAMGPEAAAELRALDGRSAMESQEPTHRATPAPVRSQGGDGSVAARVHQEAVEAQAATSASSSSSASPGASKASPSSGADS